MTRANGLALRPRRDTFDFERADAVADLARANSLPVRGHALVDSTPPSLAQGTFSRAEMVGILHAHIATVVARYHCRRRQTALRSTSASRPPSFR